MEVHTGKLSISNGGRGDNLQDATNRINTNMDIEIANRIKKVT